MDEINIEKSWVHNERMLQGHVPPHSLDAERAVLGCMILNPEVLELMACQSASNFDPPSASKNDPPKPAEFQVLFLNLQLSFPVSIISQ